MTSLGHSFWPGKRISQSSDDDDDDDDEELFLWYG